MPQTFLFSIFLREEIGETGLRRTDQIGRKYLFSALVSEKGIFQSATPQYCGRNNSWLSWKSSGKVGRVAVAVATTLGFLLEWSAPR